MENMEVNPQGNGNLDEEQKNITWETNHENILTAIVQKLQQSNGIPPTVSEIVKSTGLVRATVYNHLKHFKFHPVHLERKDMFRAMEFDIMMKLCHSALSGNIPATRLYMELTGKISSKGYSAVQFNSVTLNQRHIETLTSDQVTKIEGILLHKNTLQDD